MSWAVNPFDPSAQQSGSFDTQLGQLGGVLIAWNESPYGLLFVFADGSKRHLPAYTGRRFDIGVDASIVQQLVSWSVEITPVGTVTGQQRVLLEAYGAGEVDLIRESFPVALARQVSVGSGNTVNTGSTVSQTQSVVYDTTPINGEAGSTVTSTAAAGGAAPLVDVTDANPTGGKRKFVQKTGEFDINADGSATAPAFHGTADSVPAAGVTAGTFGAGNFTFPAGCGFAGGAAFFDQTTGALNYPKSGGILGISFFSGTGPGTFNHNLRTTPQWVGITITNANSTATVGVDSIGATTCHVNVPAGGPWTWIGVALG